MSKTVVAQLHFTVTGEFLTGHVRDLVTEGEWAKGLSTLVEGLQGMTADYALGILKGTFRLSGESPDVYMEDESPEVRAKLEARYKEILVRDVLRHNQRRYRPYGYVSCYGKPDADYALKMMYGEGAASEPLPTDKADKEDFSRFRALFYAQDPARDLAFLVKMSDGREVFALFQADNSDTQLPPWLAYSKDPQEAFDQSYMAKRDERGYDPATAAKEEPASVPAAPVMPLADIEAEEAAQRAADIAASIKYLGQVARVRFEVQDAADNDEEYGWHVFKYRDDESGESLTLRAPKRALMAFALSRTRAWHLAPDYTAVSDSGWKMYGDNPLHTDVWLGCGLPLDDSTYDHESLPFKAFMAMMYDMQEQLLGFPFTILASGEGDVTYGTIVGPDFPNITKDNILLVPTAGVEYDLAGQKAGAIVCEQGGKLAHLVTVCRETKKTIIRMDNATATLKSGMRVSINIRKGELHIYA